MSCPSHRLFRSWSSPSPWPCTPCATAEKREVRTSAIGDTPAGAVASAKIRFGADIRLVFRRPRGRCWDVASTYRSVVEALLDGPTVEHGELLGDNALGCGRDAR